MRRKILALVALAVVVLAVWQWELLSYGINQGLWQWRIVRDARPIAECLADPTFPDSLKAKLRLIPAIRQFAIDSLGLHDTENYQAVYDQKGKEILWVVMACEPFALRAKEWTFPVVGSVPYKGYFEKPKAEHERDQLMAAGYDVSIRNPGGWSTLGWFNDPILTGMLSRDEGDLASLIIHEMVHATLWVPDSVDFNENLASFIGDTAAYSFLRSHFGEHSPQYRAYLEDDQDYRKYSRHVIRGTRQLDSLYRTFSPIDSVAVKQQKKQELIHEIVSTMDTLSLYDKPKRTSRFLKKLPNNTYFISFLYYQSRQSQFGEILERQFNGNIRAMIQHYRERYPQ